MARSKVYGTFIGVIAVLILVSFWFLPIEGKILIVTDPEQTELENPAQLRIEPPNPKAGDKVTISISASTTWKNLKLYVDNKEAEPLNDARRQWRFTAPAIPYYTLTLYHNCDNGCLKLNQFGMGKRPADASVKLNSFRPTKLGVVFADPARNWQGRAGWNAELLYVNQPPASDFGIDTLAQRIMRSKKQGLRTLVRIAYDRGQALPPTGDEAALQSYLEFCARLARDERYEGVYAYFIGAGYNRKSENSLAPDRLTTPEWYARVLSGYGLPVERTDNLLELMRSQNAQVRLLVGPIAPWLNDQSGQIKELIDAPWLHYMNTLVSYLDEQTRLKQSAGSAVAPVDGFAVQVAGRPEAPIIANNPANEPLTDIFIPQWGNAQAGFRVYRDWLRIINRYPTTRNLPVFITSANTYTTDSQIDPEQNYPVGWLTAAYKEISNEPQILALCWFTDFPYDKWAGFSLLSEQPTLKAAATEFTNLLK